MDIQKRLEQIDQVIENGPYKANWASLAGRDMPHWMYDGKFGIFIHFGVYSVPSFGSEWYSRNMYIEGNEEYEHHLKAYGPHKSFGYKDLIPLFTAPKFNAGEWAALFKAAGARYVVPVAEHHDGFQMYKSALSPWNAVEMGPKRDILGELSEAVQNEGLVNAASSHRVEHWFFFSHGKLFESDVPDPTPRDSLYWPAMPEPAQHYDLTSQPAPTAEFLEDWLLRCCELVDEYHPKLLYFDWWIMHHAVKPYLKKFAAYYYNRAAEWGEEVTICYKHDAFAFGTATVDVERGKFAEAQPFKWQTDTAIARNSWCYTENNSFKSPKALVQELVDVVSKNGTLLLNVGPKPDGTISEEDTAVLLGIGEWLATNGEAIYGTTVWRTAAEGPTKTKQGQFTDKEDTPYTPEDIRFTAKGPHIYATVLEWPQNGKVTVRSLAKQDGWRTDFHGIIEDVKILGCESPIEWAADESGLHVTAPALNTNMPVVIRATVD